MINKAIYVLESLKADLETYILNINNMKNPSYLDKLITKFEVIGVGEMVPSALSDGLGMTNSRTTS
jgi:hypothetical protein